MSADNRLGIDGSIGSGGPVLGINSPNKFRPQGEPRTMKVNPADGSVTIDTARRTETATEVTFQPPDPMTPLKRRSELLRGMGIGGKFDGQA